MTTQHAGFPMDDELTERALTQDDLDRLLAEFNLAATQAIELTAADATRPDGILLPFPAPPRDAEPLYPRRRDIRNPLRPTWRLVSLTAMLAAVPMAALLVVVFW